MINKLRWLGQIFVAELAGVCSKEPVMGEIVFFKIVFYFKIENSSKY